MNRRRWSAFVLGASWIVAAAGAPAGAAPLDPKKVPAPLQPWIPWVLRGHEKAACPVADLEGEGEPTCAWSGRLTLVLDRKGGRFSQEWEVLATTRVPLPGDEQRWPLDVKANGKPVATSAHDETPSVELAPGRYTLAGVFQWKDLPEALAVPAETGLLALTVDGRRLEFPSRDDEGSVFLQKVAAPTESDSLQISVHRRIDDDIPLRLTTRVTLEVAGKARELVLGKSLPPGFVAHDIESSLPARLEPDGRLRVQARPGSWTITLVGRHAAPVTRLTRPAPEGLWKEGEEIWVFQSSPHLRAATVEGVPSVDPQQTTLPNEWRSLPAYVMAPGATLTLAEQRRGDANPAPDQLRLTRELWLDFDGGGLTSHDRITGTFSRSWRLAMGPSEKLGRVSVGGADQFITRYGKDGREGVEIRQGRADVSAESRLDRVRSFPAAGWDHDFQGMNASLNLPPGWHLLHASGADAVSPTWLRTWTLLELFLVLICAVATGKLFGPRAGALMLVALGLSVTEPEAPQWLWLAVLVGEALARALGETRAGRVIRLYRAGAWLALVLAAVPFGIGQLRAGLFPAQENGGGTWGKGTDRAVRYAALTERAPTEEIRAPAAAPAPRPKAMAEGAADKQGILKILGSADKDTDARLGELLGDSARESIGIGGLGTSGSGIRSRSLDGLRARKVVPATQNLASYDPSVIVQTGPGLPRWHWRQVDFTWNGPVEKDQRLTLWLIPPGLGALLAFVRVGTIAALLLMFLLRARSLLTGLFSPRRPAAAAGAAALLLGLSLAGPARAAEFPPDQLLGELRKALLEKPDCAPACASLGRMIVEATPDRLRLRFEASAAAATAIPLPGQTKHWIPTEVTLDGRPSSALSRDQAETLWLRLPPGSHQVVLEGPLPARDVVQISLPLKPHAVTPAIRGWKLDGVGDDGEIADTLQLTREERGARAGADGAGLGASSLPPFVIVQRKLELGLKWQVETTVSRATAAGTAVLLEVPLLPGESPLTEGLRVADGKVQVTMAADEDETTWRSTLEQRPAIALVAGPGAAFTEVWSLDASPIWHVELAGIPPVLQEAAAARTPRWQPWPGETVTLTVTRPGGAEGQTLTIESATMNVRPGARSTQVNLTVHINASRGGQHAITLPAGAVLESLAVDNLGQPLRAEGGRVTVPIKPKRQQVDVVYRHPAGLGVLFGAPVPDLGAPAVNVSVTIALPDDRWTLLVGGPRLGPSVLFWSTFIMLVLVAVALGRTSLTPLRTQHWVLLGLGLSQAPVAVVAIVAGYFLVLGLRARRPDLHRWLFDLRQILLVIWTLVTAGILFVAVREGLLSTPDMDIAGNGSHAHQLQWFADRTGSTPPSPWVLSAPLLVYRVVMLAWALWLALAVIRWSKWAWRSFSHDGVWRRLRAPRVQAPPA